jgi:hypothetical protein
MTHTILSANNWANNSQRPPTSLVDSIVFCDNSINGKHWVVAARRTAVINQFREEIVLQTLLKQHLLLRDTSPPFL